MFAVHWRHRSIRKWALLTLAFTVVALLNFTIAMLSGLAYRAVLPWKYPLIWECTDAYEILLLLPFMLWFMERRPLDRGTLRARVPLHVLACLLFAAAHAWLMWGSRSVLHRFVNWGDYDWSFTRYHLLLEGMKQLISYWSVYFVFAAIRYARESRARESAAVRLEKELAEARLSALKMQLNPHFLFNTLNLISSDIEHAPRRADAILGHLSDFLRATLRQGLAQEVSLETEVELLGAYVAIMKARFEDRLQVELAIPEETRCALVPHLLLQPLIENAITQCMADPSRQGSIRIVSALADDRLRVVMEDNGPGLKDGGGTVPAGGIGLTNTCQRLRHLYGGAHSLQLSNRPEGGLRVAIEIPQRAAAGAGRVS